MAQPLPGSQEKFRSQKEDWPKLLLAGGTIPGLASLPASRPQVLHLLLGPTDPIPAARGAPGLHRELPPPPNHPSHSCCQFPWPFPVVLTGRDGERGHGGLRGTPALHVVGRHPDIVSCALQGGNHTQHTGTSPGSVCRRRSISPSPAHPLYHQEHQTGSLQPGSPALTSPTVQSSCYQTLENPQCAVGGSGGRQGKEGHSKSPLLGDAPALETWGFCSLQRCCFPTGMCEDPAPGDLELAKHCGELVAQ